MLNVALEARTIIGFGRMEKYAKPSSLCPLANVYTYTWCIYKVVHAVIRSKFQRLAPDNYHRDNGAQPIFLHAATENDHT